MCDALFAGDAKVFHVIAGRKGEDARPLHGVDQVRSGRLSLGFRYLPDHPAG